jgi:ABC-2 type transport system permease protein
MRTLKFLLQKEFLQIFRDPAILRVIFMMPIVQLIILPFAADYEIKNINLSVVDHDHSSYSRRLVDKMTASGYFRLTQYTPSVSDAKNSLETDVADLSMVIPQGFERDLMRQNKSAIQLIINALNGVKAGLGGGYASSVIQDFNGDIQIDLLKTTPSVMAANLPIQTTHSLWYNPFMNYKIFMVPGILAILVTMVGAFLSAMNIVREKEIGTIEQLNVTPIHKWEFLLGKLVPFWVIGLAVLALGFGVARVVFNVIPVGSFGLIFGYAAVYLLAFLGFGLLLSTFVDSQQQAMFLAFFFMMIFILLGGLYTSTDSMPEWAKIVVKLNPASYFIEVIRMVVLKGSTFQDVKTQFWAMCGFATVLNVAAVINYRKRT